MRVILFQKGATSWGFQVGRYVMYWPFWRFWKYGCRPVFGTDEEN